MISLLQIVLLFIQLSAGSANLEDKLWLVTSSSRLEIIGTTNINRFRCSSTDYAGVDTLRESSYRDGLKVLEGVISLNTAGFDCENALITRDLKKTLKQDTYPELTIKLSLLEERPELRNRQTGVIEISMAGICRSYRIKCMIKSSNATEKHLEGLKDFRLSDFGLTSPEKLFGAIKVTDNISVVFHLRLTAV
ncbi:MAG: YceI family protein [Cyclobacteriaceae bacterium]|nr:YceI family protein [Cyclobacteriaceae bacterium]